MSVRIENQTCFFTTESGEEIRLAADVTILTDSEKSMSAVDLDGQRVYITEAEADALTVAGIVLAAIVAVYAFKFIRKGL